MSGPVLSSGGQLLGREREREVLDRLLDGVRGRRGGVLVVHGEAGVGKTALLDYAVEAARGLRPPGRPGSKPRWSSRSQRLSSCVPRSSSLWTVSRSRSTRRLASRSDSSRGPAPNPFLIGLAVLGLLAEAADEQPLVCVVDDAQWLDSASARPWPLWRIVSWRKKIALVFATERSATRSPVCRISALSLGRRDARALLESVLPARLDERVLERIVAETRGNPLRLVGAAARVEPGPARGWVWRAATVPLSASIEKGYARRLARLPQDERRLLLVAAADPVGDPALVWRALSGSDSAVCCGHRRIGGLLALSPRVVFATRWFARPSTEPPAE